MGQSMFGDDFMKPFAGFGHIDFPEFKMPKMPSFDDFGKSFQDMENSMKHHFDDIPKMMKGGMSNDPNGSS